MPRFSLKSPRLKVTENDVERACRELLNLRGYRLHRLHCGRARFPDGGWVTLEEQGAPDWICIHPERPGFYLETKRPGGVLSPGQAWMHRVLAAWRLQVVTVDDVSQLVGWLRSHEKPATETQQLRQRLDRIYEIVTRRLAEPPVRGDTAALMEIADIAAGLEERLDDNVSRKT